MKALTALFVILALGLLGARAGLASPGASGQRAGQAIATLAGHETAAIGTGARSCGQSWVRVAQKPNNSRSAAAIRQHRTVSPKAIDKPRPTVSGKTRRKVGPPAGHRPSPAGPIPVPYPDNPPPDPPAPCVPFTICGPETLPLPSAN